nr:acetyltransferase [Vibrio cholerae]
MVTVVVFEFGVMRCQPLRRALVASVREALNKSRVLYIYCEYLI